MYFFLNELSFSMGCYKKKLLFILFTCSVLLSFTQTFRFTQYTTHNGLLIDNVYSAAQDENGFIWFGTDFGISKFDGVRFKNFSRKEGIASKAITDIVYAGGDSCIFLAYPGTIQSIHGNGKINTVATVDYMALHQIVKHNNSFYFYQRNKTQLGILQGGRVNLYAADSVLKTSGIILHAITSFANAGIAYCTNQGLFIISRGVIKHLLQGQDVYYAILKKDNTITAVANNQIRESDAGFQFTTTAVPLPPQTFIYNMVADDGNTVWLRGLDKGIYRWQHNKLDEMSVTLGLQNKAVNKFFIDRQSNTWICTEGAGVIFRKQNSFINYETQEGLSNNRVLQLLKSGNHLFIGTGNGISVKTGPVIQPLPLPQTRIGLKYVYKMFHAGGNDLGVNVTNTFPIDTVKNSFIAYTSAGGYSIAHTIWQAALQESENAYWLADAKNICRTANGKPVAVYPIDSFNVRKVYDLIKYENKILAGTSDGIIEIENEKVHLVDSVLGKKQGEVFQFLQDAKKQLWIATENGLLIYKEGNYRMAPKGNSTGSNYCRAITKDKDGKIWCATWDGIFETDGISRINYSTTTGIISKTCNAILYDTTTSELYIGTDNGLSVIPKNMLQQNTGFTRVFMDCMVNDSLVAVDGTKLSASQNNLRFYLSAPYYNGNDEINYEYKLDNGAWVTTTNPEILLSDVSGGKHVFYARAKINGQLITKQDATFTVTIKNPFYKIWWFWLPLAVLAQLLIVWIINWYNKKIREQKLAAQQQQAELASLKQQAFTALMNPHFIFNALNSIQHYINKQDRLTANKYLSDFATLVRRSFDAAQKAFVPLDEELETVRLYLRLEKMRFAEKFNYTITLNREAETEEWMLPGMVLQPFLENAVLHGLSPLGSNGLLNIDIRAADNTLYITITDNGIGIEKSRLFRKDRKHNSRGMQLIQERLQILSKLSASPIQLTITEHNPGAENPGTCIQLVIPQQVYEVYIQSTAAVTAKQQGL